MTNSRNTHPGSWSSIENDLPEIRHENIATLLKLWSEVHHVIEDDPKWGDEVEYLLVTIDSSSRKPSLFTHTARVLKRFHEQECNSHFDLENEAYKFMLESAPSEPYGSSLRQALQVETHLRSRREAIQSLVVPGTHVFTISSFGLLSVDHEAVNREHHDRHTAGGLLTEDFRYQSVLDTIFQRCDGFPTASVPRCIPKSKSAQTSGTNNKVVLDNPVYAVGSCGLQLTFGMRDLQETLFLHDQLCNIAPLTTALTAASPIFKGALVSTDARFDHAGSVVDDRLSDDPTPTARWSLSPLYLQELPEVRALNPPSRLTTKIEKKCAKQFEAGGMPSMLSEYLAYNVCRPPLLHPKLVSDDTEDGAGTTDEITKLSEAKIARLESHLSNLYPAVRLKLPSWPHAADSLPWRLEFRAMEVPPTDFECSAMLIFLRLLKEAIIDFGLELRIPMHLLEANMNRAHVAGAVRSQKFWFNIGNKLDTTFSESEANGDDPPNSVHIKELSIDEIMNGQSQPATSENPAEPSPDHSSRPYPGLLHFIRRSLSSTAAKEDLSEEEIHRFETYLDFISKRASGAVPTPAQWTRDFVAGHPAYTGRGDVSPEVYRDMLCAILRRAEDEPAK